MMLKQTYKEPGVLSSMTLIKEGPVNETYKEPRTRQADQAKG